MAFCWRCVASVGGVWCRPGVLRVGVSWRCVANVRVLAVVGHGWRCLACRVGDVLRCLAMSSFKQGIFGYGWLCLSMSSDGVVSTKVCLAMVGGLPYRLHYRMCLPMSLDTLCLCVGRSHAGSNHFGPRTPFPSSCWFKPPPPPVVLAPASVRLIVCRNLRWDGSIWAIQRATRARAAVGAANVGRSVCASFTMQADQRALSRCQIGCCPFRAGQQLGPGSEAQRVGPRSAEVLFARRRRRRRVRSQGSASARTVA